MYSKLLDLGTDFNYIYIIRIYKNIYTCVCIFFEKSGRKQGGIRKVNRRSPQVT